MERKFTVEVRYGFIGRIMTATESEIQFLRQQGRKVKVIRAHKAMKTTTGRNW